MGQGVGGLSCCSSESTTACIDRDIGCKDFCVSADDMRPPEDEWTPMQVASLEASDFERIDPWTSPLSVAQLQAERGGLMSAMAVKKAPVTRAPPDYLADTPGNNTIVWNKAHDGHILADWDSRTGSAKVSSHEDILMKEVQRRAESNSLLTAACNSIEDDDKDAQQASQDAPRNVLQAKARGNSHNLAEEEVAAIARADEQVIPIQAAASAGERRTAHRRKDDADQFIEKVEQTAPKIEEAFNPEERVAPVAVCNAKVSPSEADAAGGDAAAGSAVPVDIDNDWVATWQVAPDTKSLIIQEPPTARAAKQQAEIQRLRMELERLEALHNSEFTNSQAKPQATPLPGQPQAQVLPPLASVGPQQAAQAPVEQTLIGNA